MFAPKYCATVKASKMCTRPHENSIYIRFLCPVLSVTVLWLALQNFLPSKFTSQNSKLECLSLAIC